MPEPNNDIGALFEQSRQNSKQIESLRGDLGQLRSELQSAIRELGNEMRLAGRPNYGTMWAAAGVISSVILGIGGLVAIGFQHEMNRQNMLLEHVDERHIEAEKGLDAKLQREQVLITQAVDEKIKGLIVANDERHAERVKLFDSLDHRVQRWESFQESAIKADLEELRLRRMQK